MIYGQREVEEAYITNKKDYGYYIFKSKYQGCPVRIKAQNILVERLLSGNPNQLKLSIRNSIVRNNEKLKLAKLIQSDLTLIAYSGYGEWSRTTNNRLLLIKDASITFTEYLNRLCTDSILQVL